jgi:putative Holliday junction resolvase
MDGSEGPMARHARNFAAQLSDAIGIPVQLHDERLSSFEAEDRLAGSVRTSRKKQAIDAVAAAVILEGWLHANQP